MQHNENNKFTNFWKSKGSYIFLALCAVAVAVSGYFFVTDALEEEAALEESLSTPVTVEEPDPLPKPAEKPAQEPERLPETAETAGEAQVSVPMEQPVLPVAGSVTQDYAMDHLTYNATTQDWRVHNGVDLAAALGQEVKAARSGTVTAVYTDDYLGTTVIIRHQDGYTSHSCNLDDEVQVVAGDQVKAGQVIGAVGDTALLESAETPHLHFEVYHNGDPVDPAGFLY